MPPMSMVVADGKVVSVVGLVRSLLPSRVETWPFSWATEVMPVLLFNSGHRRESSVREGLRPNLVKVLYLR